MKFFDKGIDFLNKNSEGVGITIAATTLMVTNNQNRQAKKKESIKSQTKRLHRLHKGQISGRTYMREQKNDGRSLLMIAEDLTEFNKFAKVNKKLNGDSFKPEEYEPFENFLEKYTIEHKLHGGTLFSLKKETTDFNKVMGSGDVIASQSAKKENPPFARLSYGEQRNIKKNSLNFLTEKKEINEVMHFSKAVPEDKTSTHQVVLPSSFTISGPPFWDTPVGELLAQFGTGLVTLGMFIVYKKIYDYFQDDKKDQKAKVLPESKSTASSYIDIVVAYNKKEINEKQATNLLIYFYQMPKDKALFLLLGTEKIVAETQEPRTE